eukprot:COSAG01_NODE_14_length_41020_cov_40.702133_12_plen_539_part_00
MFKRLHINNLALIEDLYINLDQGLSVLSGETGAGKSMILTAISLLIGSSASEHMIGKFAPCTIVEGTFQLNASQQKLSLFSPYVDDDGQLHVFRKIRSNKTNIIRINDVAITLKTLKQVFASLVLYAGQHAHLNLLNKNQQSALLDACGDADYLIILENYKRCYQDFKLCETNLDQLLGPDQDKHDLLNFQLEELLSADLKDNEDVILEENKLLAKNNALYQNMVFDLIKNLENNLELSHQRSSIVQKLDNASFDFLISLNNESDKYDIFVQDAIDQLRQAKSQQASYDDEFFDKLESRLDLLFRLKQKYNCKQVNDLLNLQFSIKNQLEAFNSYEQQKTSLLKRLAQAKDALILAAQTFSIIKIKLAKNLSDTISNNLRALSFDQATFKINVQSLAFDQWQLSGPEQVVFEASLNAGSPSLPIQDVASGGELSRILLALQDLILKNKSISCIVFDEIDTGIGGYTANAVASYLSQLSMSQQLILVTHLPQIAAKATQHFFLNKDTDDQHTRIQLSLLSPSQKKRELSRMIGGLNITS